MKSKIYRHDIILILISSFFYLSSPMLVTPLITGYSESLGASAMMMGIIGGLMNICALFCRPFVGNLADKISKYKLSFIGAGLMTISCIGYILAWNPTFIIISRNINGIGYSCCSVCMSTWMSNLLPKEKIGSGMGLYGTMNALGMAISPAIGVSIYESVGYKTAFLVATIFIVLTILSIQFVYDKGEPILPEQEENASIDRRLEIVDRKVIPIAIIIMFFAAAFMAGGYGLMCSVCQSRAILLAGKGKRGLANSTYYIGLDLGMSLGPIIGGGLYGNINIIYFYPILAITVPFGLLVYGINHYKTVKC